MDKKSVSGILALAKGLSGIKKRKRNNIKCPKCKHRMWDSEPGVIRLTEPPKKKIHCETCGYQDFHIMDNKKV